MEEGPLSPTAREKKGVNAPSAATPATREAKTIALADILQRGQNERQAMWEVDAQDFFAFQQRRVVAGVGA